MRHQHVITSLRTSAGLPQRAVVLPASLCPRHIHPEQLQQIYLCLVASLLALLSSLISIVLTPTAVCCKTISTIKTSDIKLCTLFPKRQMNHENSKTEMLMVCACCVMCPRIMEVDTWLDGRFAFFFLNRLNDSHAKSIILRKRKV